MFMPNDYLNEYLILGRGRKGDKSLQAARAIKARGHALYFNKLCGDCHSRIYWKYTPPAGMADTVDTDTIEKSIIYNGAVAFTKRLAEPRTGNLFVVRPLSMNNLSFYGYPTTCQLNDWAGRQLYSSNGGVVFLPVLDSDPGGTLIDGDGNEIELANCVIMYDNPYRTRPIDTIAYYAKQLSDIRMKIIQCIDNIRGASLIFTPEEQGQQTKQILKDISDGKSTIISFDPIAGLKFEPVMLTAPGAAAELKALYEAHDKTYADFIIDIGVKANNEVDKKSGTTPMEVIENRQIVDIRLSQCINAREKAIKQMEKIGITGLELSLDNFKSKTGTYDDTGKLIGEEGEEDGEKLVEPGEDTDL